MQRKVTDLENYQFVMVGVVCPLIAEVRVDPLASPTPQSTERAAPPAIIGNKPVVVVSEGNQGETHPSDILIPGLINLEA